jgi:hypothetical protein
MDGKIRAAMMAATVPVVAAWSGPSTYLCISDYSVGFHFEIKSGWRSTNFRAGEKYILRTLSDEERSRFSFVIKKNDTWGLFEFGDTSARVGCHIYEPGGAGQGVFMCHGPWDLSFNPRNLRYELHMPGGYTSKR